MSLPCTEACADGRQGVFNIPQPGAEEFITKLLDLILDQNDAERAYVKFAKDDVLVLLVNNQGGMSVLEMGAVVDETLIQLEARGIVPARVFNGPFMGSMNMPGVSLSLLNLTNVAAETGLSVERLFELIDAPHRTTAWPANTGVYPVDAPLDCRKRADKFTEVAKEEKAHSTRGPKITSEPDRVCRIRRPH